MGQKLTFMAQIKVGFCVAYDWVLLKKSLPKIYKEADKICLSIDKNRTSWSGKKYEFDDQAFRQFVEEVDIQNKIKIYEDNFSLPELSSIENDNRQRTMMAQFLGENGWHIQIDSDEYFADFKGFVDYLKLLNPNPSPKQKPINVCCNWISLIKKTPNGYLYVDNHYTNQEKMPFATNKPEYLCARINGHFNHISPFFVLHETWSRDKYDLKQKIESWGHDKDFLSAESYYKLWESLDEHNFKYIRNFHPINPCEWSKLSHFKAKNIDEILAKELQNKKISRFFLFCKNSRTISSIKALWKRLF